MCSLASINDIGVMEMKRVFAKVASQMGYAELRPKQEVTLHYMSGNNMY